MLALHSDGVHRRSTHRVLVGRYARRWVLGRLLLHGLLHGLLLGCLLHRLLLLQGLLLGCLLLLCGLLLLRSLLLGRFLLLLGCFLSGGLLLRSLLLGGLLLHSLLLGRIALLHRLLRLYWGIPLGLRSKALPVERTGCRERLLRLEAHLGRWAAVRSTTRSLLRHSGTTDTDAWALARHHSLSPDRVGVGGGLPRLGLLVGLLLHRLLLHRGLHGRLLLHALVGLLLLHGLLHGLLLHGLLLHRGLHSRLLLHRLLLGNVRGDWPPNIVVVGAVGGTTVRGGRASSGVGMLTVNETHSGS